MFRNEGRKSTGEMQRRFNKIWQCILVVLLPVSLWCQTPKEIGTLSETIEKASPFITATDTQTQHTIAAKLSTLINDLELLRNRIPNDDRFLRRLFQKTHRNVLEQYQIFSSFEDTMVNGGYGCLSGTTLYALLLSHFGFEYQAMELPSHVYLMVYNHNSTFIIESTLPSQGFIAGETKVTEALKGYTKGVTPNNAPIVAVSSNKGETGGSISKKIGFKELAGLQWYNKAVEIFKSKETDSFEALTYSLKAHELYPSVRTNYLMQLVMNDILKNDQLSDEVKEKALSEYSASRL